MKKYPLLFILLIFSLLSFSQVGSIHSYKIISNNTNGLGSISSGSQVRFGTSIDTIGDLNNDGIIDLIVGTPKSNNDNGVVYILFMDSTGSVKSKVMLGKNSAFFPNNDIVSGKMFGRSVAGIGDINGDNIPDVAVGSEYDNDGGSNSGSVRVIFLDTNGTAKGFQKISKTKGYNSGGLPINSGSKFGIDISYIGDINNDGVNDITVGNFWDDAGGTNSGAAWVLLLNSNGKVKSYKKIYNGVTNFSNVLSTGDYFGVSVSGIGDINNDSINDIAVGCFQDDDYTTNSGSVFIIHLNQNGSVKSYSKISNSSIGAFSNALPNNEQFGVDVAGLQDIDNNGTNDLLVGAYQDSYPKKGAAYIILLDTNSNPLQYVKIDASKISNIANEDKFAFGVSSFGDMNNNGYNEILVGAPKDDDGGVNMGAMYVIEIRSEINIVSNAYHLICENIEDGSISLSVKGPNTPFTYLWSNGQTTDSISNLAAGTYTVTVTNNNGRTKIKHVTITSPPPISISSSSNSSICIGHSVNLNSTASGGVGSFTYNWNNGLPNTNTANANPTTSTTYSVYATDGNNCSSDTNEIIITVNNLPIVNASGLNVMHCSNENPITLSGSPSGGNFTGSGISNGNIFNPANSITGSNIIIYTYSDNNGCSNTDTLITNIVGTPNIQLTSINNSYCANENSLVLASHATPTGGTFWVDNTTQTTFDLSTVTTGLHIIKYQVTNSAGCSEIDSVTTYVNNVTPTNIMGLSNSYCEDAASITLNAIPSNGQFKINGTNATHFSPSTLGVGTYSVEHILTNLYNCKDTAKQIVIVHPTPSLSISTLQDTFCSSMSPVGITALPVGGFLTGPGVNTSTHTFNPSTSGIGHKTIYYSYTNTHSCSALDSHIVYVSPSVTASFSGLASTYCINDTIHTLHGLPIGGTFYGNGINANKFNPILAGVGTHMLNYIFDNGCKDTAHQVIQVFSTPNVQFITSSSNICSYENPITLEAIPTGGVFSGYGVSGNMFNPTNALPGYNHIDYTYTDSNGCYSVDTIYLSIAPETKMVITGDSIVCFGEQTKLQASGASSYIWDYGQFGPNFNYKVSYSSYIHVFGTDTNNCLSRDSVYVTVNPLPVPDLGSDDTLLLNNSIVLFPGNFDSYLWNDGSINPTYTVNSLQHPFAQNQFSVTVGDVNGCFESDTINVLIVIGINENDIKYNIKAYPNPAHDYFNIDFGSNIKLNAYKLYDSNSRLILSKEINRFQNGFQINVSNLSKGNYYLVALVNNEVITIPLIVQ